MTPCDFCDCAEDCEMMAHYREGLAPRHAAAHHPVRAVIAVSGWLLLVSVASSLLVLAFAGSRVLLP